MNFPNPKTLLLALAMALVTFFAGAAIASAGGGSGGVGTGGNGGSNNGGRSGCVNERFGSRTLAKGDCGSDVKTLNWMLRSKEADVDLAEDFSSPTASAVRSFERDKGLSVDGVVEKETRSALTNSLARARPPGTARPSTATASPAAAPCTRARSASPTRRCPAGRRSSSATRATGSARR